jgi:acetoin utilization deacetylase AcuC-like enzyme
MTLGIVKDERFADHAMGPFHVESPSRITAVNKIIEKELDVPFLLIPPRPALEDELAWIHTRSHIAFLKETADKPPRMIDPDTSTSPKTYATALLAAGGGMEAVDAVMQGRVRNAFALIRPPGHHAEPGKAMGFCFFNNTAIAAERLVHVHGLRRILVVDWDLHHGNGIQNAFSARNDVLYFSIHQAPLFPGTGLAGETGTGPGEGFTINVPLRPGKGDGDYLHIIRTILAPVASRFRPEFILVSAGYDVAAGDPLGGMRVTRPGFGRLTAELMTLAEASAQNRMVFFLEGGYDKGALGEGLLETLRTLAGKSPSEIADPSLSPGLGEDLAPVLASIGKRWQLAQP